MQKICHLKTLFFFAGRRKRRFFLQRGVNENEFQCLGEDTRRVTSALS